MLKEAFLEHVESRNFRRLIPSLSLPVPQQYPSDQMMFNWFSGKCKDDVHWCN